MIMRMLWVAVGAVVCAGGVRAEELSSAPVSLNIPKQALSDALNEFARQARIHVAFYSTESDGLTSPALSGTYTPRKALEELLANTPLTYSVIDMKTVAIQVVEDEVSLLPDAAAAEDLRVAAAETPSSSTGEGRGEDTKGIAGVASSEGEVSKDISEIIVTAQKRSERLQDVPVPVTALNAAVLVDSNQARIQDYYSKIPGLNLQVGMQGQTYLAIRGITTDPRTNPTVGVVIDDVPFGASSQWGNGGSIPDVDPGDLERIEVLRGPQGTLYGANSIGGLLKYVTADPSFGGVSGRLQGGIHGVDNGGELGYIVRGSVNVPLSENFALRASGFTGRDPGYVDDPVHGLESVNRLNTGGGRLSGLWRPSAAFSIKIGALIQDSESRGSPTVFRQPGFSDLEQSYIPGAGQHHRRIEVYSAVVRAKLGPADFTAISGYNENTGTQLDDFSSIYGGLVESLFDVRGALDDGTFENEKFTQEARLSIPIGGKINLLGGLFYTHEKSRVLETIFATDEISPARLGEFATVTTPTKFTERAAFTNLTVNFTDMFDVQLGARLSRNEQRYGQMFEGLYVTEILQLPSPLLLPTVHSEESPTTYLVTPRLKISDDMMIYARLASGYRAGGPNGGAGSLAKQSYESDETRNYEVGMKGEFLDDSIAIDASLYYIDWKNVQIFLCDATSCYTDNVGQARSKGVELSLQARAWQGATISAWATWGDSALTQDFPATSIGYGVPGDRLPFSTNLTGNLSIDQTFPLGDSAMGAVGGSIGYVGEREGLFTQSALRQEYPAYTKVDLHAGVTYGSWEANIFINNVADKRGSVSGGMGTSYPTAFNIIQPRTLGLSLTKSF